MKPLPLCLAIVLGLLAAAGCNKNDCLSSDISIENYVQDSIGNFTQYLTGPDDTTSTGLYYRIVTPGDTVRPQLTDTVVFTYTGRTTGDDIFGQTGDSPLALPLAGLIRGWQFGLPLIGQGGRIMLYIPSRLGYASSQAGEVCPDTDLIFDVTLQEVR
ncbi:FKBP-type peptidyl-prolyl cis-trans isomerase [Lewinella sp. IMCC34183]|uniref:FKBP-type peptidyl-prolyl cis-trans isomerase n=1 Tax=Lewinella sp. IMCC34183 TaxID=2248762 RepID=UPI000E264748|nr:FKBP-type peptidyl-prolyl cis-trans isomerase [Lewinella sp. IMCC34183]